MDVFDNLEENRIFLTPKAKKKLFEKRESQEVIEFFEKLGNSLIQNNEELYVDEEMLKSLLRIKSKSLLEEKIKKNSKTYFKKKSFFNGEIILEEDFNFEKLEGESKEFSKYINSRYRYFERRFIQENPEIKITRLEELIKGNYFQIDSCFSIVFLKEIFFEIKEYLEVIIEDSSGIKRAKISRELVDKMNLFPNEVILIEIEINQRDFFIKNIKRIKEIQKWNYTPKNFKIVALSDVHSSSIHFYEKEWYKMIDWLIKNYRKEKIKYLIISGDNVEGIGIFPGQELTITLNTLKDQYLYFNELIKKIPEEIRIICIPGNHDLVRLSEPQPELGEDIIKYLSKRIIFLKNPALISIQNYRILIYHGRSLNQFSDQFTAKFPFTNPIPGLKNMIKMSHLCPTIQGRTQIYPSKEDHLILKKNINLFLTGHIHVFRYSKINGIHIVNCSAWMGQSDGMKRMNFLPEAKGMLIINVYDNSLEFFKF